MQEAEALQEAIDGHTRSVKVCVRSRSAKKPDWLPAVQTNLPLSLSGTLQQAAQRSTVCSTPNSDAVSSCIMLLFTVRGTLPLSWAAVSRSFRWPAGSSGAVLFFNAILHPRSCPAPSTLCCFVFPWRPPQELQEQWERVRAEEQSRGAGAADVRRWTGIRNIVEAREMLRTLFISACTQRAQVRRPGQHSTCGSWLCGRPASNTDGSHSMHDTHTGYHVVADEA